MRFLRAALTAALTTATVTVPAAAQTDGDAKAATITEVAVTGHGWGHGRGMGQYGAFGYARDHGWTWQQITDHFYGGTTLGTLPAGRHVDALLKGSSGRETLLMVEQGGMITNVDPSLPVLPGRRAVRVKANSDGTFVVFQSTDCATWDAGTAVTPAPINGRSILVAKPAVAGSNSATEMIALCEGSTKRFYRGEMWVGWFSTSASVAGSTAAKQHVMNHVWNEQYLRSVVPRESPASWPFDALAAQAIAARSYEAAGDTRYGWATTCDDIFCQVYYGYGSGSSGSSITTRGEDSRTDAAIAATENRVRMRTTTVARTEFSSSTGGWTAGGSFPAVEDLGDAVSANPNHNWSATVPVSTVEAKIDAHAGRDLGGFRRFVVVERNGLGADGGRVRRVTAEMANGSITITGDQFRSLFGLKSDWFTPTGTQTTTYFSDTAGHAHEENIDKVAAQGIAGGYPDGTFRPDEKVTRAQMATFLTKGYDLPAGTATFSDIAGDTHEASIKAAASAGVARGYPDGTYRPAANVTRGQMAVFLTRAEQLAPLDGTGGCDIDGHPFEREIRAVLAAGIASGAADGCFHPDDPVTRGQMATFLARALEL